VLHTEGDFSTKDHRRWLYLRSSSNDVAVQERLRHLAHAKPEESLSREVEACGSEGRSVSALAHLLGMSPTKTIETLQNLPVVIGRSGTVVARSALDFVAQSIRRVLDEHSSTSEQGLGRDKLRTKLNHVSSGVMEIALAQLIATDEVRQDSGRVYLAHSEQEQSRAREENEAASRVAMILLEAGLMPPESKVIFAENPKARRAVDRLVRSGVVIRVIERVQKRELLFHREAIRNAQKLLEPKLETAPGLLVSDITGLLGISRKYCIPLLEHLDSVRYTRRIGDRRVLYPERQS
jgi:selenocysteine-specific elongation factor